MIIYDEPLYRPPSEAESLIIQATLGCSHNRCVFCGMYKSKTFKARPLEEVLGEISYAASSYPGIRRVFLADGDAMALETDTLLKISEHLHNKLPQLERISLYANPGNIHRKSDNELKQIREGGIKLLYLGIESGSDLILKKIRKGADAELINEGISRSRQAGLKVSATLITGLGGAEHWEEHISGSAELINRTPTDYLSTLTLMVDRNTVKKLEESYGHSFTLQNDIAVMKENRMLIEKLNPESNIVFMSNHASNALPLRGILPAHREKLLAQINRALSGNERIRPSWMRGL